MTDYRSIERLEVRKNGERVADLIRLPKGCRFEYTREYLASDREPIALHLPKSSEGMLAEGIANLPTFFAGLLPEGVMFTAIQRLIRAAGDDLFAILAATGSETIGDIDLRIPGEDKPKRSMTLAEANQQIQALLSANASVKVDSVSAISGVQPKMSIGEITRAHRTAAYLAKFEPPEFPGLLDNEFDCLKLAKKCGLSVVDGVRRAEALVVKRFDRVPATSGELTKLHVEDLCQAMDIYPNSKYSVDFAEVMGEIERLGVSKATLLHALRLYVFSYIVGNGDLHAKNVSLIYDSGDRLWRLSPAYDLICTLPYVGTIDGADRMALALGDDAYGRFTAEEFAEFGARFALPKKAVLDMVYRTASLALKWAPSTLISLDSATVSTILDRADSLTNSSR